MTILSNDVRLVLSNSIRLSEITELISNHTNQERNLPMEQYRLGEMEQKFADLIWAHAPVRSGELAVMCAQEFGWKRTTTYTMLKRLCERRLFVNEKGIVSICMTKEEFQGAQGEQFVNETFHGSLPRFLAAFTKRKKLSDNDIRDLKQLINDYEEDTYDGTNFH